MVQIAASLHRTKLLSRLKPSDMKTQPVPRSKHTVSVIKTNHLMLYREIIAVCSQIHTKHTNTLCGLNVELLNAKLVVHKMYFPVTCTYYVSLCVY